MNFFQLHFPCEIFFVYFAKQPIVWCFANKANYVIIQIKNSSTNQPAILVIFYAQANLFRSVWNSFEPHWRKNMEYFDEYDVYNFDKAATSISNSRKGRTKREAKLNTNRPNPGGHERKVTEKLKNTEKKRNCRNGPRTKWSMNTSGNTEVVEWP